MDEMKEWGAEFMLCVPEHTTSVRLSQCVD